MIRFAVIEKEQGHCASRVNLPICRNQGGMRLVRCLGSSTFMGSKCVSVHAWDVSVLLTCAVAAALADDVMNRKSLHRGPIVKVERDLHVHMSGGQVL